MIYISPPCSLSPSLQGTLTFSSLLSNTLLATIPNSATPATNPPESDIYQLTSAVSDSLKLFSAKSLMIS
ncbi:hypothetical protein F0562_031538 [Nyssa sinensis]|uniref:Uncharacterized protein n=1 Tax=Nyssa sinensis TaxID=561372 RepID=A0A5J5AYH3_9ASTE|nr:hypothetical protein F0562_031538 [Nyssa sinensis]